MKGKGITKVPVNYGAVSNLVGADKRDQHPNRVISDSSNQAGNTPREKQPTAKDQEITPQKDTDLAIGDRPDEILDLNAVGNGHSDSTERKL